MRLRTTFLWSMIVSLALAAALGIIAILWEGLGDTGEKALITSLLVGVYSLVCLACAFVLGRRRAVTVMWIGIIASLAALAIWLIALWFEAWRWGYRWEELMWKSGWTSTVVCLWAAHLGLMVLPPIHRAAWGRVRVATIGITSLIGAIIIVVMWPDWWDWQDDIIEEKILPILAILASCGTVVTPVLALIDRIQRKGEPIAIQRRILVTVVCPRCEKQQQIRAGRGRCSGCGLRIDIHVEEPRCACGYPLYQLQSDRCPECGRHVPPDRRWKSETAAEPTPGAEPGKEE